MKTLLQINSTCNSGSTGRIAAEIGDLAIKQGWESYIAFGRTGRECSSKMIKIGNDFSVYNHVFQTRAFDRHGLASSHATKELIRKIEIINPEIIHLHNIHGYYLNYDILFKYLKNSGIPIVWTLHDCWPFTGHCCYFDFRNCDKWKSGCLCCPSVHSYPKSLFDCSARNFLKKKESFCSLPNLTLVPVSNWLSNLLTLSFLKEYPIRVIHNGIDTEVFTSCSKEKRADVKVKYGVNNKRIVLGVANIWNKRKGLDDFIKLRAELEPSFVIVLVGLSKEQINILPPNMIGIEHTENVHQLAELYSAADVFVNPTLEDNFPTTNIEALACGTPVITYNTGGSPEAISDKTGLVVKKGDIQELKKAILKIDKEKMSKECRDRAIKTFDKKQRYMDYVDFYKELIAKKLVGGGRLVLLFETSILCETYGRAVA